MNKRNRLYVFILFNLFLVVTPAFLLWFFFGSDITKPILNWKYSIYIWISVIILISLLNILLIRFKWLSLNSIAFVFPLLIVGLAITYSYSFPIWARVLIIIASTLSAIIVNLIVIRIDDNIYFKNKHNNTNN